MEKECFVCKMNTKDTGNFHWCGISQTINGLLDVGYDVRNLLCEGCRSVYNIKCEICEGYDERNG